MKRVLVVGAGLSGLATACALSDAGFAVTVIEATGRAGGLIGTARTAQGMVERAANAFVWNEVSEDWFRRLGVTPVFPKRESRRRFIFARGRARRWPLTLRETAVAGARIGAALVQRRLRPQAGESVAAFADRVGGKAVTQSLLGPALQGIYGAQPHELSATAIFGKRRGRRGVLATPANGMGAFIDALCRRLADRGVPVRFKAPIELLDPKVPTVVCTNVAAAARLLRHHAPGLSKAMASTAMTGLLTATSFFSPHRDDLEGFGVLFPRSSGVDALGVLFNTSIFDGRGALRSETWIYPGRLADDEAHVTRRLTADRMILTGRDTAPIAVAVIHHDSALPVYGDSIGAIHQRLTELPSWLRVSGNYLGQIGVTHLIARADAIAADVSKAWA